MKKIIPILICLIIASCGKVTKSKEKHIGGNYYEHITYQQKSKNEILILTSQVIYKANGKEKLLKKGIKSSKVFGDNLLFETHHFGNGKLYANVYLYSPKTGYHTLISNGLSYGYSEYGSKGVKYFRRTSDGKSTTKENPKVFTSDYLEKL